MILCDSEIVAALNSKQVIITPRPPAEHITTTAVDLTLGREFKCWRPPGRGVRAMIDPSEPGFYQDCRSFLGDSKPDDEGAVAINPGDFLLAITEERVHLPITSRLAARVEGRSSLARLGLGVHVTAPTVHAGFHGQITLEMTNQGKLPIRLRPGLRICQLIFEMSFGTPSREMTGIFQDQSSVLGQSPESEA